jgi:hypothetical protein
MSRRAAIVVLATVAVAALAPVPAQADTGWTVEVVPAHERPKLISDSGLRVTYDGRITRGDREITQLQLPGGGGHVEPLSVNTSGAVSGWTQLPNYGQPGGGYKFNPTVWDREGRPTVIPLPAGAIAGTADAITNSGLVVGAWYTWDTRQLFTWTRRTGFRDLGDFGGLIVVPTDANEAGTIVGSAYESSGASGAKGFVVTSDKKMETLPAPPGYQYRAVAGINNAGDIVGMDFASDGRGAVWVRTDSQFTAVTVPGCQYIHAAGINDLGLVSGTCYRPAEGNTPFAWQEGKVEFLPVPAGATATAHGVNAAGEIWGSVETSGNPTSGAVWHPAD